MGDIANKYKIWVRKTEVETQLGGPKRNLEDNIKMDLELKRQGLGVRTGLNSLRIGSTAGSYKYRAEPSRFIKCGEFID
jgi:hypothetical protein